MPSHDNDTILRNLFSGEIINHEPIRWNVSDAVGNCCVPRFRRCADQHAVLVVVLQVSVQPARREDQAQRSRRHVRIRQEGGPAWRTGVRLPAGRVETSTVLRGAGVLTADHHDYDHDHDDHSETNNIRAHVHTAASTEPVLPTGRSVQHNCRDQSRETGMRPSGTPTDQFAIATVSFRTAVHIRDPQVRVSARDPQVRAYARDPKVRAPARASVISVHQQ